MIPLKVRNQLIVVTVGLLAIPAILAPLVCLFYLIVQGVSAWDWALFSGSDSHDAMLSANLTIWPQILGSLALMLGACALALPIAIGVALFHVLRASTRLQAVTLMLLHLMQGIPPIVYGLSGLVLFVHLMHWGISLLTGQVILAVIIMPLFVENIIKAIERIDINMTQAARSLGLSDAIIIWRVWLPHAWSGILTGLLLGMARALSETAPILFTATVFSGVSFPESLFEPVASLQTHIFYLAQEGASDQARGAAWASALILITLISVLSIGAGALRRLETINEQRS